MTDATLFFMLLITLLIISGWLTNRLSKRHEENMTPLQRTIMRIIEDEQPQ